MLLLSVNAGKETVKGNVVAHQGTSVSSLANSHFTHNAYVFKPGNIWSPHHAHPLVNRVLRNAPKDEPKIAKTGIGLKNRRI